jgi:hypothetical protein
MNRATPLRRRVFLGGLAMPVVVPIARAHAQDAATPDAASADAFVRGVYARYAAEREFLPFFDPGTTRQIATPSLAALAKQDKDLVEHTRNPSLLDFDPVCVCQDPEGLRVIGVEVKPNRDGSALAIATIHFSDSRSYIRLLLKPVHGEWRIDDIQTEEGTLRDIYRRSIAANRHPR